MLRIIIKINFCVLKERGVINNDTCTRVHVYTCTATLLSGVLLVATLICRHALPYMINYCGYSCGAHTSLNPFFPLCYKHVCVYCTLCVCVCVCVCVGQL